MHCRETELGCSHATSQGITWRAHRDVVLGAGVSARNEALGLSLAIGVFFAFGLYQMYRYAVSHSASMIVLTVLDVFVIVLTSAEYRRLKSLEEVAQ